MFHNTFINFAERINVTENHEYDYRDHRAQTVQSVDRVVDYKSDIMINIK